MNNDSGKDNGPRGMLVWRWAGTGGKIMGLFPEAVVFGPKSCSTATSREKISN